MRKHSNNIPIALKIAERSSNQRSKVLIHGPLKQQVILKTHFTKTISPSDKNKLRISEIRSPIIFY